MLSPHSKRRWLPLLVGLGVLVSCARTGGQRPAGDATSDSAARERPDAHETAAARAAPEKPRSAAAAKRTSAEKPGTSSAPAQTATTPDAVPQETRELPDECAAADGDCFAPDSFVKQVCRGRYPGLAVFMFNKGSPWTRLYLKAEFLAPVNAYGGPHSDERLEFGEEVLLLRQHGSSNTDGLMVSGSTDIDILRWDGSCATVRREMFVTYIPGPLKTARIIWKYLDDPIQAALSENKLIRQALSRQKQACKSSSVRNPTEACRKATTRLNQTIVVAMREGLEVPAPDKRPSWTKPNDRIAQRSELDDGL